MQQKRELVIEKDDELVNPYRYFLDSEDELNYISIEQKINFLNDIKSLTQYKVKINEELACYADMVSYNDDLELKLIREYQNNHSLFFIYLRGTNKCVGYIEYLGKNNTLVIGDVILEIKKVYRNNGYGTIALNLFEDYLLKNGITDMLIALNPNNTPALKIVKHHGGIKDSSTNSFLTLYKVNIKKYTHSVKSR